MRKLIQTICIAFLAAAFVATTMHLLDGIEHFARHIAPKVELVPNDCQEDEPCWDCATMGNRICGFLPED